MYSNISLMPGWTPEPVNAANQWRIERCLYLSIANTFSSPATDTQRSRGYFCTEGRDGDSETKKVPRQSVFRDLYWRWMSCSLYRDVFLHVHRAREVRVTWLRVLVINRAVSLVLLALHWVAKGLTFCRLPLACKSKHTYSSPQLYIFPLFADKTFQKYFQI